jgi:LytR cell envelope-related transcriptional attenuator
MRPRPGDRERGVALPPWAIGVSIGVVVLAMLAFVVTGSPDRGDEAAADPISEASPSGKTTAPPSEPPAKDQPSQPAKPTTKRPPPDPDRHERAAYVEIYNNSGIAGLANETAARLQDTGWKVVGADNWYGNIPASTVYYPERLRADARLLAADLGIRRLHAAVDPMRFDRLTVILTGRL